MQDGPRNQEFTGPNNSKRNPELEARPQSKRSAHSHWLLVPSPEPQWDFWFMTSEEKTLGLDLAANQELLQKRAKLSSPSLQLRGAPKLSPLLPLPPGGSRVTSGRW